MNFRTRLRQLALILAALALLNAPFALWAYSNASHLASSEPDSTHTFSVSFRGIGKLFYTPLVGMYLIISGVLGCAAGGSLIVWRLFPEKGS